LAAEVVVVVALAGSVADAAEGAGRAAAGDTEISQLTLKVGLR